MDAAAALPGADAQRPRLLLLEDDEQLRRTLGRMLAHEYTVVPVASVEEALELLRGSRFDLALSDVNLGGMSGVVFLQRVREFDLDLPVLLMTGEPTVETAARAVEYGAVRYLVKPLDPAQLKAVLTAAVSVRKLAEARRQSFQLLGHSAQVAADRAGLDAVLDSALRSLRVAWQPIVSWQQRRVVGYEALTRSKLPSPDALIDAAARAGRSVELGRAMRSAIGLAGALSPAVDLYVNVHPQELLDEQLYDPASALCALANRVVLEVTERASLESLPDLRQRIARLRKLGFRIALDDLGSGYAGLSSFALLEPDVVKLDLMLVRDLHHNPTRRRLIDSILSACRDLRCATIAEGVELPAERDALVELGCELFQGYLFARPGFAFPVPQF